jgi:ubiquinone/menaquinone biosynthesis C-methylase UbiE
MSKEQLYESLAPYYDLLYHWKDYPAESELIRKEVARHKRCAGKTLLDVACGTGAHLVYLSQHFNCEGMDFNKAMLKEARKKRLRTALFQGDMLTLNTGKTYDVITCLFGSIAYTRTVGNLKKALKNFYRHLNPGGICLVDAFVAKSEFHDGMPHMQVYEDEDLKIARAVVSTCRRNTGLFDFHFLITERDKGVRHFQDYHEIALFEHEMILKCMEDVGFKTQLKNKGLDRKRPLFIGVKR